MSNQYSVQLSRLIRNHHLTPAYLPRDAEEILITSTEISRPGLELTGYMSFFDSQRIQIMGNTETAYLGELGDQKRGEYLERFFSHKPVAVILTRDHKADNLLQCLAERYGVALLCTPEVTSSFMAALIANLNVELAPRITRHGVLVEVYGLGILITGESGVGKSETAMELVKRGHRIIADDAVEIRRVSPRTLVGSSPKNIRHFMELRGIGIINVERIYGVGSVKITEQISFIIQLEHWDSQKVYDRMGVDNEYTEILGNRVPIVTIPVKPGRNLAIIIEVAAMNQRQKEMGYNAAAELLSQLGIADELPDVTPHADLSTFD